MTPQEYLKQLIEDCKIFAQKSKEVKEIYTKLFPDNKASNDDVFNKILSFTDEEMKSYFTASQSYADLEVMFSKISNYLYFMKQLNIELDLTELSEVENLTMFIASHTPFETEFVVEGESLKEKDSKRFENKLNLFKKSIKVSIDINNDK